MYNIFVVLNYLGILILILHILFYLTDNLWKYNIKGKKFVTNERAQWTAQQIQYSIMQLQLHHYCCSIAKQFSFKN